MTEQESMTSRLTRERHISPPNFVPKHVHYETEVGSVAYGVIERSSDVDIYGFCVPPKELVFPHMMGEIPGFGRQKKRFEQYQQHGVEVESLGVVYDLTIYSIVRYFGLCMENNPNMIESLFTPKRCILYMSDVARMVRERRTLFLHKGAWHKFKGFAYAQLHKMNVKKPVGKRVGLVERFGFDVKFAYHAVRLMDEAEQVLTCKELDLEASKERLMGIRRGEWTQEEVQKYCAQKEVELAALYESCTCIPHSPDESAIKTLLLDCLEQAYGDLSGCIVRDVSSHILWSYGGCVESK